VKSLRRRPTVSPSLIVAVIALIVAMGGTSYAAITLPRNSVGDRQIRAGAVRSSEVRDRSLSVRDLSVSARTTLRGAPGPPGPPGPAGGAGTGVAVAVTVRTAPGTIGPAGANEVTGDAVTAACLAGERVVGGGVSLDDVPNTTVHDSFPAANGTAWSAHVGNDETAANTFTVYAICAR
jgi:hypothetical protein